MKKQWFSLLTFFFISCNSFHSNLNLSQIVSSKNRLSLELRAQLNQTDPQKPTFCSISLNTKKQKDVFKEHLGSFFNFVELFKSESSDWFEKSLS